jgi:hypothetical protein
MSNQARTKVFMMIWLGENMGQNLRNDSNSNNENI